jgi:hypothetical protein
MKYKARKIYKKIGYVKWENFDNLIGRAKNLIANAIKTGEIEDTHLIVDLGCGAKRKIKDYLLDDDALNLLSELSCSHKLNKVFSIRNEIAIISLLKKYCAIKKIPFKFQYKLGSYIYDCRINNFLLEFDEPHHKGSRQKTIDWNKDIVAKKNNYKIIRIELKDDIMDIIKILKI